MPDYWHDLGSSRSESEWKRDTNHLLQSFTYVFSHFILLTLPLTDEKHFNAPQNQNVCRFSSL